jgi:hypothetical protein
VADLRYGVEMISGMPVVVAPATIDVTTADHLRRVLLDAAAVRHATVSSFSSLDQALAPEPHGHARQPRSRAGGA